MKRLILTLLVIPALLCQAQHHNPTKAQADKWFDEMRAYKTDYIVNALQLSQDQREKFISIYNTMSAELDKIARETRQMERKVSKNNQASDLEYEKAADALFELRAREGAIDQKYYPQLKAILTKKQLFQLKAAERRFGRHLMKEREGKGKRARMK